VAAKLAFFAPDFRGGKGEQPTTDYYKTKGGTHPDAASQNRNVPTQIRPVFLLTIIHPKKKKL
jgi:hypothetical protein